MATIPGVSNNELVRTTWGNAVATELNGNSVRRNGMNAAGTAAEQMTGPLLLPTTQSTTATAAVHKSYVDTTTVSLAGDTMTGDLEFGAGGGPGFSGLHIDTTGHVDSTVGANVSNLALNRIGAADTSGGAYIHFETGTSGGTSAVTKASITRNAADNGIAISNCNTTAPSDYRLKDDLGPVVDPTGRVMALVPRRLRWKEGDDPTEFEGFFAHEVATVAPYTVIGEKDAADMQQLDVSGLVPLLVAALQTALADNTALWVQVNDLANRVAALEAASP